MGTLSDEIGDPSDATRPAHNRTGDKPRLTLEDAVKYIQLVNDTFRDDKRKFHSFVQLMKDFKEERVDTFNVISWVETSFKGHDNLILGFNAFLPENYQIKYSLIAQSIAAIKFVEKIKTRFQNSKQVFYAFLNILNHYRIANRPVEEIYQEVSSLFQDHEDLLEDFRRFLPNML